MNRNYILFFALAVSCLHSSLASGQVIRTVALTGQPAPGTTAGETFSGFAAFDNLVIDNSGRVSFQANLQGGERRTNDSGLWTEHEDALHLLARSFFIAPGYSPETPTYIGNLRNPGFSDILSAAGNKTLVKAGLVAVGMALYEINADELDLMTGARIPAPGTTTDFYGFREVTLNANGNIAFSAFLTVEPLFQDGIWTDARGSLELVALEGSQVEGMPLGVTFDRLLEFGKPALNSQGKLAFATAIREPTAPSSRTEAILAGQPGLLNAVVREGDQAPGTTPGTTFRQFSGSDPSSPKLDSEGRLLFGARLTGSGIDDTNDDGFWLENAGSISLVAREGDQAPDLAADVNYIEMSAPLFNSRGDLVLHSRLTGPGIDSTNDGGIWTGTPDSLRLLLQKGDPAPGLAGEPLLQVSPLALNEAGRLAVRGNLPGLAYPGGVSNHGVWAQDSKGQLQLIVKTGDLLEISPGDFREVDLVRFGGFNDRGQIVFSASFGVRSLQSTSGIFVSNLVAVPEPISIVMLLVCLVVWPHRITK